MEKGFYFVQHCCGNKISTKEFWHKEEAVALQRAYGYFKLSASNIAAHAKRSSFYKLTLLTLGYAASADAEPILLKKISSREIVGNHHIESEDDFTERTPVNFRFTNNWL